MERCLSCLSNNTRHYFHSEKILECSNCGLVFLSSKLVINNLDQYYKNNSVWHDRIGRGDHLFIITKKKASSL